MWKALAKLILKISGWYIHDITPADIKKCIIISAPHTSMWDFVLGRLGYMCVGVKPRVLIKKEAFSWPFGGILKALGGIPVDRKSKNNMVKYIKKLIDKSESIYFVITPEGTRKANSRWKRGFYYIAVETKVPIALGFLDYKKKEGGIGKMFWPTGNIEEDMKEIKSFYLGITARHPEKFRTGLEELK